jgi:hypothetical protein
MIYLYIAIAAIAPIVLIAGGKRFLGSQTHPAAIFILAWMLCGFLLSLAEALPVRKGILSFVWVAICFPITSFVQRTRSKGLTAAKNHPNPTE